ncbi:MAG: FHA domain-containing protein [Gemmatimonadota bacterium]|nr:MAG: FHA domain-containing protein [Gemmatimonadota bacterium]
MDLVLIVRAGELEGRGFMIAQGDQRTIGRAPECDIRLPDQGVSRRHCTVENGGNALHVVDLDSANGTEINGRLVYEGSLSPGDRLQLGPTVLECYAPPEGVRETERAEVLDLQCPKCKETLYTTWDWVERPSGGHDIVCVCEHCGHRWLREEPPP